MLTPSTLESRSWPARRDADPLRRHQGGRRGRRVQPPAPARARAPHPFLTGIHQPMTDEMTLVDLPVTGTIPAELDGRYLRIGPNPVAADPAALSLVHRRRHGPRPRAEGRQGALVSQPLDPLDAVGAALGEPPAPGPRHGGFDTVNTNVVEIAGRTWALVEAGSYPVELDETLDEQTYNPFDGTLDGIVHRASAPRSADRRASRDLLRGDRSRRRPPRRGRRRRHVSSRGADPGRARPVDPRLRDHRALRDHPRPAGHLLDEGADRRAPLPLSLEPGASARGSACCRATAATADVIWCDVDPGLRLPRRQRLRRRRRHGGARRRAPMPRCSPTARRARTAAARGLERWTIDPADADGDAPHDRRRAAGIPAPRRAPLRPALSLRLCDGAAGRRADAFVGATRLYKHDLDDRHARGPRFRRRAAIPANSCSCPRTPTPREDEGWLIGLVIDLPGETTDLVILDARRFEEPPSPASASRTGYRRASTAIGYPGDVPILSVTRRRSAFRRVRTCTKSCLISVRARIKARRLQRTTRHGHRCRRERADSSYTS